MLQPPSAQHALHGAGAQRRPLGHGFLPRGLHGPRRCGAGFFHFGLKFHEASRRACAELFNEFGEFRAATHHAPAFLAPPRIDAPPPADSTSAAGTVCAGGAGSGGGSGAGSGSGGGSGGGAGSETTCGSGSGSGSGSVASAPSWIAWAMPASATPIFITPKTGCASENGKVGGGWFVTSPPMPRRVS